MRTSLYFLYSIIVMGLASLAMASTAVAQTAEPVTRAEFDSWMQEISNWGRWGAEDELGTLNLITEQKRVEAARLVRDGTTVSLSLFANKQQDPINANPFQHTLTVSRFGDHEVAGDTYSVQYHGFAHSHMDGLPHFAHKGQLYNGFSVDTLTAQGAGRLGIHNAFRGIFTRGILVDIPWLWGVDYLEPGTAITAADLEAWEARTGVRIGSGDVLLIRTGRWERVRQVGQWNFLERAAGSHASLAKWLKERDVAVIGSDGVSDVMPSGVEGLLNPLHELVIVGLGMPILDNLVLDPLAAAVREKNRFEFLLVGSPLRVEGGTGSPMNPLALF
ncbi:MAG: cyclase family protein [Gammaproteobacteria bacterium]|nr:cyclase family protein [Gammaproteobacteria bacterium]MDP6731414.1 cyclase family protein [Gammaproteobacteria bacterium]|tara:strand:- start:1118 stop:2113 length:996 start_codon:yes stop_codon:yes gene_type:complete